MTATGGLPPAAPEGAVLVAPVGCRTVLGPT